MNFTEQGRVYIDRLKTRNRHPIKPASVAAFESYLRNHVVPHIGTVELEPFNNGALKSFVQTLIDKKLAPKTIAEVSSFVRAIVASVLDKDGNQVYPRTWNLDFVDAPPIQKQRQPTLTKEFLQAILRDKSVKVRDRVLLALLGATGLRIGELQALQIGADPADQNTVWDPDERMIHVRKSVWRGKLQDPKTAAAVRDIDLSTPVNKMLQEFAKDRQQGEFLLSTKSGKPLEQSYISTYILKPLRIPGCHALRRLRVSHLREVGCNESILKAWLGHSAGSDVTNKYDKTADNIAACKTWAERCGTGLDLSDTTTEFSAPRNGKDPSAEIVVKRSLVRRSKATPSDISTDIQSQPDVVVPPAEPYKQPYVAEDSDLDDFFRSTPETVHEEA